MHHHQPHNAPNTTDPPVSAVDRRAAGHVDPDNAIDQNGLDLAVAWGVVAGTDQWVHLMTQWVVRADIIRDLRGTPTPLPAVVPIDVTTSPIASSPIPDVPDSVDPISTITTNPSSPIPDVAHAAPPISTTPTTSPPGRSWRGRRLPTTLPPINSTAPLPDEARPWICEAPGCEWAFARREHLRRHVASRHIRVQTAMCSGCGRGFTRKDNLRQHARTCSGLQ